ncbi:DNAJ domain-containing protein [Lepidopterella palustris CBS 459.81]|uniref:DNAJ domain-containing protein n=1 Tax=Lepidopterella palustris CBS 459.81 TaxID=1314670 RepID=A0A8E2JHT7_9PEZI|nr:DNAJ domain-containing protein [Lepidopterella palustris CBS 459.81]
MKPKALLLLLLVLCASVTIAAAWTKEDHEIFRLQDEVTTHEGPNVTFYDLVGVKPGATQDEIVRAYRKKSRQIHPDKARQSFIASYALQTPKAKPGQKKKPGVHVRKQPTSKEIEAFMKTATSSYQRLTVVVEILKGESRERYDHFLKNGFPKWRGTGYYYARFRPGLGSVLLGLLFVGGGAVHYGALFLSWKRQREFVERYIRHARRTAWGDDVGIQGIPGVDNGSNTPLPQSWDTPTANSDDSGMMGMNRRQKRMQEKEARKAKNGKVAKVVKTSGVSTPVDSELISGPSGTKKRVLAQNGKVLIVDSVGNVYLEEETEDGEKHEYLLDVNEIHKPTIFDTLLFRIPKFFYDQSIGRVLHTKRSEDSPLDSEEDESTSDEATLKSITAANPNVEARKRKPKVRAR